MIVRSTSRKKQILSLSHLNQDYLNSHSKLHFNVIEEDFNSYNFTPIVRRPETGDATTALKSLKARARIVRATTLQSKSRSQSRSKLYETQLNSQLNKAVLTVSPMSKYKSLLKTVSSPVKQHKQPL